jgi:hypothetical protein
VSFGMQGQFHPRGLSNFCSVGSGVEKNDLTVGHRHHSSNGMLKGKVLFINDKLTIGREYLVCFR